MPEVTDDGIPVEKACDAVRVYSNEEGEEPCELFYYEDCAFETAAMPGWYWLGLEGVTLEELDTYELEECTTIKLCPIACANLQGGQYDSVSASFGCEPVI